MRSLQILGIVGFAVAMNGCTPDWARDNETNLLMAITNIEEITSDVSSLSSDIADVSVQIFRKNPTVGGSTPLEDVRLERYEVRFLRSDGANVEGSDVPVRHTGPLNEFLHAPSDITEASVTVSIPIVRDQAKREAPLRNLIGIFAGQPNGPLIGVGVLTTFAEVTVHARQVTTGKGLMASARTRVIFADIPDTTQ